MAIAHSLLAAAARAQLGLDVAQRGFALGDVAAGVARAVRRLLHLLELAHLLVEVGAIARFGALLFCGRVARARSASISCR